MKGFVMAIAFCAIMGGVFAQGSVERGLQSINRITAEAHIGFLASDELEGREAGCPGGRIASLYIAAVLRSLGISPLEKDYFQPFDACRKERQRKGRWQIHPDSIAVLRQEVHQCIHLNNVLGILPGRRANEYVVVGAHFDHIGFDPSLVGDQIYNGADDNASGVSAVLQIARAFVASGQQPERTVIFAFWDGEEIGLLGSKYFVQSCRFLGQIKGYLNFDMIGRDNKPENPQHVVYFYTEAHPVFGQWLREDIQKYHLKLDPVYKPWDRPVGGSDNASFALQGIPVIWYHTDGHPDYHLPTDHADRINWEKVTEITKASFLNVWNLANEKEY